MDDNKRRIVNGTEIITPSHLIALSWFDDIQGYEDCEVFELELDEKEEKLRRARDEYLEVMKVDPSPRGRRESETVFEARRLDYYRHLYWIDKALPAGMAWEEIGKLVTFETEITRKLKKRPLSSGPSKNYCMGNIYYTTCFWLKKIEEALRGAYNTYPVDIEMKTTRNSVVLKLASNKELVTIVRFIDAVLTKTGFVKYILDGQKDVLQSNTSDFLKLCFRAGVQYGDIIFGEAETMKKSLSSEDAKYAENLVNQNYTLAYNAQVFVVCSD